MKVYLSGKISGLEEKVYKKNFAKYADILHEQGHYTVSPVSVGAKLKMELHREPTYQEYMKADISELLKCEAICMLPNWKSSKGASLEKQVAETCGMKIIEYREV